MSVISRIRLRLEALNQPEYYNAKSWRFMLVTAAFLATWSVVVVFFTLRVLASIYTIGTCPSAFIAGYCFRQTVLDRGGNQARSSLRGQLESHHAVAWRLMLVTAVFLTASGVASAFLTLPVLASVCTIGTIPTAFISGYCFRQTVLDRGRLPWARTLWLRRDEDFLNRQ
jgi:succinate dehydrogenase hydrophobic anchor subunit